MMNNEVKVLTKEEMAKAVADYREMQEFEKEVKKQLAILKEQMIATMLANKEDTFLDVATGNRVTYKETRPERFDVTLFKKEHHDIYEAYKKVTPQMNFKGNWR